MTLYLAGEITQVKEPIPWVRCASGNVYNVLLIELSNDLIHNIAIRCPDSGLHQNMLLLSLPSRSPGDPTAGARARGGSRGAPGQGARGGVGQGASRVPPSVGSSRQSGSRGRMPPTGPSSRHQTQLYHQDLAYYDVDSRVGRGGIPVGLEGGQTNDRVMEWMLGVERSGGAERSQDQRSLSSRGASREAAPPTTQHLRDLRDSRTSPRSKQRQAQHRSMSQERAAMSSSWSGHPAMSALNYQATSNNLNSNPLS